MDFRLLGNVYGFQDANAYIYQGDFVRVKASGWITTRAGEAAGPDGKNNKGELFDAVDDIWGNHPSTEHKKYTLLVKIEDTIVAAGNDIVITAPVAGRLSFAINDNMTGDNGGFWRVEFEYGTKLRQRFLFVNHNVPDPGDNIKTDIEVFCRNVEQYSAGQLGIEKEFLQDFGYRLEPDDFREIFDDENKPAGFAPTHNQRFMAYLNEQGYDLSRYQMICRIYKHEPSFPQKAGARGVMFAKWPTGNFYPYVTCILTDNTGFSDVTERPLTDVILHEYLHVLDDMFDESGTPGFASPHDRQTSSIPYDNNGSKYDADRSFYFASLGLMADGFSMPPYARLCGDYGQLCY